MELGTRIKELREGSNWSQYDLSHKANVDLRAVLDIENNKKIPNVIESMKIAQALGITIDELVSARSVIHPMDDFIEELKRSDIEKVRQLIDIYNVIKE